MDTVPKKQGLGLTGAVVPTQNDPLSVDRIILDHYKPPFAAYNLHGIELVVDATTRAVTPEHVCQILNALTK
jgi:hypothetical protein